jgi:hypothetical protein
MLVVHVTRYTSCHGARDGVVMCVMACNTADDCAANATFGRKRRRSEHAGRQCDRDENFRDAHLISPTVPSRRIELADRSVK